MADKDLDYYSILGVDHAAEKKDIDDAFRALALAHHPSRCEKGSDPDKFDRVCEAYDVLSTLRWKAILDKHGYGGLKRGTRIEIGCPAKEWERMGVSEEIECYTYHGVSQQVFKEFFGVDHPSEVRYLPDTKNLTYLERAIASNRIPAEIPKEVYCDNDILDLSLEEMYNGCIKKVRIVKKFFNADGNLVHSDINYFHVEIKPGCPVGKLIKFEQQGDERVGEPPGDVVFRVRAKSHSGFVRDGHNLIIRAKIALGQALTGIVVEIPTLDKRTLHIPINDIIAPESQKVVPKEGMPHEDKPHVRGDLIIKFSFVYPDTYTISQKEMVKRIWPEEFKSSMKKNYTFQKGGVENKAEDEENILM